MKLVPKPDTAMQQQWHKWALEREKDGFIKTTDIFPSSTVSLLENIEKTYTVDVMKDAAQANADAIYRQMEQESKGKHHEFESIDMEKLNAGKREAKVDYAWIWRKELAK